MSRTLTPLLLALLVTGLALPAAAQPFFDAPWRAFHTGDWETGRYDLALVAADFNGDGLPDAAVGQGVFSGGVRVLLSEGSNGVDPAIFTDDGAFYPTSRLVWDLVAADLDGDGDVDIAASQTDQYHLNGTQVVVLLNAGNGTFDAPVYYDAGPAGPHGIVAGDFDGDGDVDLAVANLGYSASGTAVSVLMNDGDGTFAAPASYAVAEGPNRLEAGDLDGDDDIDLVVAHEEEITVSVLVNDGDGTFGSATTYANLAPFLNTAANGDVALADFDNDGDLDAFYANAGLYNQFATEPQLVFLRNDGTGAFTSQVRGMGVDYESTPYEIAAADVSGDGVPDLVTAQHTDNGFFVLLGDGNGGFASSEMYAGGYRLADGGGADAVALADLDGDGDRDVLTVNRIARLLTVHENLGDGTFPRRPISGRVFLHNVLEVGDVDNDGDPDVATSHGGVSAAGVSVHLSDSNGAFTTSLSTGGAYAFAKLRDLDGDGNLDLLYVSAPTDPPYDFFTRLGNGDGTFHAEVRWPVGACGLGHPAAFDVDNDGDLDVINPENRGCIGGEGSRLVISLNNGDGTFQPPYTLAGVGLPSFVGAADFDEDGALDLVTVGAIPAIYFGNGDGSFAPYQNLPVGGGGENLLTLDLDGDGHVDMARLEADTHAEDRVTILLGDGDGGFTTARYTPTLQWFGAWLNTGDVDGDGDPDLVGEGLQDAVVFLNDGAGAFSYSGRYGLGRGGYAPHYADFTGDGVGDLVALVAHDAPPSGIEGGLVVVPGLEGQPAAPVTVAAQPVGGPVVIGPGGGSFRFTVTLTNTSSQPQSFQAWTAVTGPVDREPVMGPLNVTLPPGATLTRTLRQQVPGSAPAGTYAYHVRLGALGGAVLASDSFPFTKEGAARGAGSEAGWAVSGWDEGAQASATLPEGFALSEAHPNPFDGRTRLTLDLAVAQHVTVAAFDALGRRVAVLLDGVAEAGAHALVLDGSALPAGVYVVRVTGESFTATRRITLLR